MSASSTRRASKVRSTGSMLARKAPALVDVYRAARAPRMEAAIARDIARTRRSCAFLPSLPVSTDAPTALLVLYRDDVFDAKTGLVLASALRLRGVRPVVSVPSSRQRRAVRLAAAFGVADVVVQEDVDLDADEVARRDRAVDELLRGPLDHATVADWCFGEWTIGSHVLSTVIRLTFDGSPDLGRPDTRDLLRTVTGDVITNRLRAEHVLDAVAPRFVLLEEANYSVNGPLVDAAVARDIDVLQTIPIWRDDALMSKRLTAATRRVDAKSVAPETFEALVASPLTAAEDAELDAEFDRRYDGTWQLARQFQPATEDVAANEIVAELGLDPSRPTAVVFAHVLWDATLFVGVDLFENYAEWLVATVRAAVEHSGVNWIVKAHPSNVFRIAHGDVEGECSELVLLRERVGELPDHVRILRPDTRINTVSLYRSTDAAVTVRGTAGLEMACFGKPTFTAGTGNYAGLGFTRDSGSVAEYLERLHTIETAGPLSAAETGRARRYAHTLLLRRPWLPRSFALRFDFPESGWTPLDRNVEWVVDDLDALHHARDLDDWADWALGSRATDYLPPSSRLAGAGASS